MTKKTASLALVIALAGTLGFAAVRSVAAPASAPPATAGSVVTEQGAAGEGSAAVSERGARDFHLGASFTYDVKSDRAYSDPSGKALGAMDVSGRLVLTVVGAKDGGAAVRGRLEEVTARGLERDEALGAPFFFVLAEDGRVMSWGFDKTIPGEARRQVIAIVSSLQLAPTSLERLEGDVSGEAMASYTKQGSAVVRTKSRYERVRTPAGLTAPGAIGGEYAVASRAVFAVDASGWPASLDEQEKLTATFKAGAMTMSSRTTATLVAKGEDRSVAGSYEAAAAGFDPDVEAIGESVQLAKRNADLGLVKGATFSTLMSDLEASPDARGRNRAVARMSALFRTSPEALPEARAKLLAADTSEPTKKAIAGALGSVKSPAAQAVLVDALGAANVSASVKTDAAMSLGQSAPLGAEAKDALRTASRSSDPDVASAATLALGSAAHGDGADDVVTDLLAKLESAATPADRALALEALGNSGSPRALQAILACVGDGSSMIRAAALGALKFQHDDAATKALTAGMFDADPSVRRASLGAVGQQDLAPFVDALLVVLQSDKDVESRVLAVRVLARGVNLVPAAESVLDWAAQHDAEPRVRDAAVAALSKPKP